DRETVNAEIPLSGLRWIISHIPEFPVDLANRMNAMGMGVLVGWGPLRNGTNVGPPYRMLMNHPIKKGYHSDGGDITVINPWLNFSTIATGRNLAGQQILGDQMLTRQEVLWLATAANKWFIWEDDIGSIEVGNHGDLAVLDRDCFSVSDEDFKHTRSVLTVVGGKVVHNDGVLEPASSGCVRQNGDRRQFFSAGGIVFVSECKERPMPEANILISIKVAPQGMGLNDFVAYEEGFFADEGIQMEFDAKTFRGTQSSWKGMDYFDRPQDKAVDDGVIQCACAWGTISNASAGMGLIVPDCHGISP